MCKSDVPEEHCTFLEDLVTVEARFTPYKAGLVTNLISIIIYSLHIVKSAVFTNTLSRFASVTLELVALGPRTSAAHPKVSLYLCSFGNSVGRTPEVRRVK